MTAPTLAVTEQDVCTALRGFLLAILPPPVEVIRGQVNRVPQPATVNYVVFWVTNRRALSTNRHVQNADQTDAITLPTEISVQMDVHGEAGSDNAQRILTLFRDQFACGFFAALNPAIQPLYASDPRQLPFITEGHQYQDRWVVEAVLQANPVVTTVQQSATDLAVELIEVDTTYPPGAP